MAINSPLANGDAVAINADLNRVETGLLPECLNKKFPRTVGTTINTVKTMDLPYSSIRVLQVENPPGPALDIFLKRITIPGKEQSTIEEALIRETCLLDKLNESLPDESVELIASFPEQQIIATKACTGQLIDEIVNAYPFWWQPGHAHQVQRQQLARLCGDWLKRFHTLTELENQHLKPWHDYLCGEMDWRTQVLKKEQPAHAMLYSKVADKFYKDMNQQAEYGPASTYHGDFAPHNIFIDQHKITVIDFFGAQQGSKLIDIINFIASIVSRAESPLYPSMRINTFCQQFIAAYALATDIQHTLVAPLLALQSIKRLLVLQNNKTSRIDHKFAQQRSARWHRRYVENYLEGRHQLIAKGPWPFLDLSALSTGQAGKQKMS